MITQFRGEYKWLSNFAPCLITLEKKVYKSVEHAYMSAKNNDEQWKQFCQTKNAGTVKRESKKVKLLPDWENKKIEIMQKCLTQKYTQEPYRTLLINTKNEYIQEGNWWHDTFWGICLKTGKGKNILGKLIMNFRDFKHGRIN